MKQVEQLGPGLGGERRRVRRGLERGFIRQNGERRFAARHRVRGNHGVVRKSLCQRRRVEGGRHERRRVGARLFRGRRKLEVEQSQRRLRRKTRRGMVMGGRGCLEGRHALEQRQTAERGQVSRRR